MDKKVYYGEYTLKYWIDLLLKRDLVLPPYQRSFVWSESQVKGFVKGIDEDGFVPPVTIFSGNKNKLYRIALNTNEIDINNILFICFLFFKKLITFSILLTSKNFIRICYNKECLFIYLFNSNS